MKGCYLWIYIIYFISYLCFILEEGRRKILIEVERDRGKIFFFGNEEKYGVYEFIEVVDVCIKVSLLMFYYGVKRSF